MKALWIVSLIAVLAITPFTSAQEPFYVGDYAALTWDETVESEQGTPLVMEYYEVAVFNEGELPVITKALTNKILIGEILGLVAGPNNVKVRAFAKDWDYNPSAWSDVIVLSYSGDKPVKPSIRIVIEINL